MKEENVLILAIQLVNNYYKGIYITLESREEKIQAVYLALLSGLNDSRLTLTLM